MKEKFDPAMTYGRLPGRIVKVGDVVRNEALYQATSWTVLRIERRIVAAQDTSTDEALPVWYMFLESTRGTSWFSGPFKWIHNDGTAIRFE